MLFRSGQALGDDFNPEEHGSVAFPDVEQIFKSEMLKNSVCFKDETFATLFKRVHYKAQANITKSMREKNFKDVMDKAKEWDRAAIISGGGEGAAWLEANPSKYGMGLNNDICKIAYINRLRIPIMESTVKQRCPHCSNTHAVYMYPDADHIHSCKEKGKGNARALRTTRHYKVLGTIVQLLKQYQSKGGEANRYIEQEPRLDIDDLDDNHRGGLWKRYPGITRNAMRPKCRGDIKIVDEKTQINDLVITHANVARVPRAANIAGAAAEEAYQRKMKFYTNTFVIPLGQFEPLAMEVGGRWHPRMRKIMCDYFKRSISISDMKEWSRSMRHEYSKLIATVLQRVSVSLTICISRTLSHAQNSWGKRPITTEEPLNEGVRGDEDDYA